MVPAVLIALSLIALPPPLCRGRIVNQYNPNLDQPASERAVAEVQAAYEALCPKGNCGTGSVFKNDTIGDNAVTWVSGIRDGENTRAKIVYSPRFLDRISQSYGPGASFGVLAHEVGHHLTAALGKRGMFDTSWNEELRADYLAGCALGRSGRPPDELENALKALAAIASPTHPAFDHRVPVVRKGYLDCKKHQETFDRLPDQNRFGVGAVVRAQEDSVGCWRYFFRAKEELDRVGPVAAKRRRSKSYASQEGCERARRTDNTTGRTTEACVCL